MYVCIPGAYADTLAYVVHPLLIFTSIDYLTYKYAYTDIGIG